MRVSTSVAAGREAGWARRIRVWLSRINGTIPFEPKRGVGRVRNTPFLTTCSGGEKCSGSNRRTFHARQRKGLNDCSGKGRERQARFEAFRRLIPTLRRPAPGRRQDGSSSSAKLDSPIRGRRRVLSASRVAAMQLVYACDYYKSSAPTMVEEKWHFVFLSTFVAEAGAEVFGELFGFAALFGLDADVVAGLEMGDFAF